MSRLKNLEKGLARGNVELAVQALLALAADERTAHVDRVAPLFREEVERCRASGGWARLPYWGARAEREPRLLDEPARWSLAWGCAQSGDFARAQRLFAPLAAGLRARCAPLADAVEAYLSGSAGAPVLSSLCPAPPAPDARLGVEPRRAERSWSPPRHPGEVEAVALRLRALESWPRFAAAISKWWAAAAPEVADQLRRVAGELAARELLLRLQAQASDLAEPATLLCAAAREGKAHPALARAALDAFCAVASALPEGPLTQGALVRPFCELAVAAARDPGQRPLVREAVLRAKFGPEARSLGLRLVEQLAELECAPPVVLKGLRLFGLDADEGSRLPAWLENAVGRLLEAQGPAVAAALESACPEDRRLALVGLARAPSRLLERLFEQTWDRAPADVRRDLCALVATFLEGLRLDEVVRRADLGSADEEMVDALVGLMMETAAGERRVPTAGRGLWAKVEARVAALDPELLALALANAGTAEAARGLARAYLEKNPDLSGRLEAMGAAVEGEKSWLADELVDQLRRELDGDGARLAAALIGAARIAAPRDVLLDLAADLRRAVRQRPPPPSSELEAALDLAARLGKATRRPAKRPKKKRAAPRRPRAANKPPTDGELPF